MATQASIFFIFFGRANSLVTRILPHFIVLVLVLEQHAFHPAQVHDRRAQVLEELDVRLFFFFRV